MEARIIEAVKSVGVDPGAFEEYYDKRAIFESWRRTGVIGAGLEDHRRKVEQTFADCLKTITRERCQMPPDSVPEMFGQSVPGGWHGSWDNERFYWVEGSGVSFLADGSIPIYRGGDGRTVMLN